MSKLGQEPAFPMVNSDGVPGFIGVDYSDYKQGMYTNGMSKRLYLAGMAMQSIISRDTSFNNNIGLPDIETTVSQAYAYADELLKQEGEDNE